MTNAVRRAYEASNRMYRALANKYYHESDYYALIGNIDKSHESIIMAEEANSKANQHIKEADKYINSQYF